MLHDAKEFYAHLDASVLKREKTLFASQFHDLKFDDGKVRYWLSRCTVEDGESYNNKVTVEKLIDGKWIIVDEYKG